MRMWNPQQRILLKLFVGQPSLMMISLYMILDLMCINARSATQSTWIDAIEPPTNTIAQQCLSVESVHKDTSPVCTAQIEWIQHRARHRTAEQPGLPVIVTRNDSWVWNASTLKQPWKYTKTEARTLYKIVHGQTNGWHEWNVNTAYNNRAWANKYDTLPWTCRQPYYIKIRY